MLGSLIGAGLGVASSIFGGISARKARRKQERMLAQQEQENQAWYDRKYNEDPTKRADTVRLLTQMQEQIKNRNKAAKGRQAVMGGTEDSTTAVKEANNKTLADTTSQIVAANEARKDAIEGQYQARKDAIQNKRMGLEAEKAAGTANVAAGVAGTAANIAATIDGGLGNSKVARPSVSSPTQADMDKLDAKVGAAPSQQQVASDLNDMIGDNAPKKVNV
jgi:hypothetical protein|nr:MAG TPA: hypothetical protein [Caudoviricetes sp.]